jgi:hypothetical protein
VKSFAFSRILCFLALAFAGCLATPVSESGGPGAVTVTNTNPTAIIYAAQSVFAQYGYSSGYVNYPTSASFDKPAGKFGKAMWGGYDETTTVRVRLLLTPLPGGANYRLSTRVFTVSDAGEAGFEDKHALSGLWSGEFGPLLRQISARASGAGPR